MHPLKRWATATFLFTSVLTFGVGCAANQTQVVWRKSKRLGCGEVACGDGSQIVVCNYEPAGNMSGEPAY